MVVLKNKGERGKCLGDWEGGMMRGDCMPGEERGEKKGD